MAFLRDKDDLDDPNKKLGSRSEVGKAFGQGILNLRSAGHGAVSAGAALIGQDEFAEEQLVEADYLAQRAADEGPELTRIQQVETPSDFAQYTANTVVSQLPNIASLLTTHRVGRVLGRGARNRLSGTTPKQLARAERTGGQVGTVGGASVLETGSLFPELAGDEEARENHSLQSLAAQSLAGGTASGALEAVQPLHVFDKFGVGKAGRGAIKKALREKGIGERVLKEALTGAGRESATEGLQTIIGRATHKFANENFEVFGEEGIDELVNAMAAGGVVGGTLSGLGGIPNPNKFAQRLEDTEAQDELNANEAKRKADYIASVDADAAADLQGVDLTAPDAVQQVNDIAESRGIDMPDTQSLRIARGHAKDYISDHTTFQEDLLPALQEIALGNIALTPEIQTELEKQFDNPGKMLDRLAEQAGVRTRGQFELLELERGIEAGTIDENDFEVQDRMDRLMRENASPEFESLQREYDQEKLDEGEPAYGQDKTYAKGESAADYQALNLQDTDGKAHIYNKVTRPPKDPNDKKAKPIIEEVPFLSSEASSKLAGRDVENSQVRNVRELNEQAGEEKFTLRKYTDVLLEQASRKGAVNDKQSLFDAEARRIVNANPALRKLAKTVANSKEFLDSLEVIEQVGVEPKVEAIELTKAEAEKFLGKASREGTKLPRGAFQISVGGTVHNVNAHDLVSTMLKAKHINRRPTKAEIASAFNDGLTSLLSATDGKITELGPSTIIFTKGKGERGVTFGSIQHEGAASLKRGIKGVSFAIESKRKAGESTEKLEAQLTDLKKSYKERYGEEKRESMLSRKSVNKEKRDGVLADRTHGREIRRLAERDRRTANEADEGTVSKEYNPKRPVTLAEAAEDLATAVSESKLNTLSRKDRGIAKNKLALLEDRFTGMLLAERKKSTPMVTEVINKYIDAVHDAMDGFIKKGSGVSQEKALLKIIDKNRLKQMLLPKTGVTKRRNLHADGKKQVSEHGGNVGAKDLRGSTETTSAIARDFLRKAEYFSSKSKNYDADIVALAAGVGMPADLETAAEAFELAESLVSTKKGDDLNYSNHIGPSDEYMRSQEKPADLDALQKTATQWLADLGITKDITMLTYDQAKKIFTDRGRDPVRLVNGSNRGFLKTNKDGTYSIYVSPMVGKKQALEILGHETGHIIFKETVRDLSTRNAKAVRKAFEAWRAQFGRSATLSDIFLSKQPLEIMMDAMSNEGSNTLLDNLSAKDREYLLDFEEWFADNTAKWMVTNAKPVGVIEQFFSHIADLIKELARNALANTPDGAVTKFLNDMLAKEVSARAKVNLDTKPRNKLPKDLLEAVQQAVGLTPRFRRGTESAAEYTNADGVRAINMAVNLDHNPYDELANQTARAAFDFLLTPEERGLLGRAFSGLQMQRTLKKLLEGEPEAQYEVKHDPEAAAAYGYQFWIAGQIDLGPKTQTLYERVAKFVTDILGFIHENKQSEQIFKALRGGILQQRAKGEAYFVVEARINKTLVQKSARFGELAAESLKPFLGKVFYTADSLIRSYDNAHLTKLTEMFHARVGTEGVDETMFAARDRRLGRFKSRLATIFEDSAKDKAFGERVVDLLNSGKDGTTDAERKAVGKVRALFQEMRAYMVNSNVEVGNRGEKYFPHVFDVEQIKRNHDKFIEAIAQSKYDAHLFAKEMENSKRFKPTQEKRIKAAQRIYDTIVASQGLSDVQLNPDKTTHTPYFGSMNKRNLAWLEGTDLAPFLSKDLGLIVTTYIEQGVKRAEFTSRFGKDGHVIEDMIEKAKDSGATTAQIDQTRKYVEAMMGTLGADIDPKWHKFQGGVMVYQNLRLLSLSTLTSLVDVAGIAVRGDLNTAWMAFKAGAAEINAAVKGDKTVLRQMAEALGTIDQYTTNEALGWEYGGHHVTGLGKKINDKFFEYIQLQRWTRATRIMALAGGKAFIEKHARGTSRHSERFLAQLNLSASDVKLDKNGSLKLLTHEQRKGLSEGSAEFKRDERVRTALNRWVDEAILRPNAAQRPIWASDPHWMLVFHLKAFVYSFHDRILRRVGTEAEAGNYTPMLLLGGYVPIMMASDLLREVLFQGLFDGDDADDYKEGFTLWDHVQNSAARAGLNGIPQLGYDALRDVQYGGDGITSIAGPTASHVRDITKLFMENSRATWQEAFVDSLPANSIYRRWDFMQ